MGSFIGNSNIIGAMAALRRCRRGWKARRYSWRHDQPAIHGFWSHSYDFVLVKSSGYQGPEFSTQYTAQIQAHVEREDSGFVRLPQRFAFPDDAQIVIFAAESVLP